MSPTVDSAGKTVACINELLTRALATKKDSARYAYISPFYRQSKLIAWDYLKQYGQKIIAKTNESELYVELFNGSRIYLFGADNPDALRGMFLDGVIMDEFADMKPSIWGTVIRPLLTDRKGWAVFIGTPKGHNGFYDIYQQSQKDPDWFSLTLRASTSGLIDQKELIDAQKSMSEDQYRQEFECSFEAAIVGSYYGKLINEIDEKGQITGVPYNNSFEVNTFWDVGRDAIAVWFEQKVAGETCIIDYYEKVDSTLEQAVKDIKAKEYNYGTHVMPHDAGHNSIRTGITLQQQALNLGLRDVIVLPRDDIDAGIELLSQLIPRLWFDREKCYLGLERLKLYKRKFSEERKIFLSKPEHDEASHGADAARYMATWLATRLPVAQFSMPGYYAAGVFSG